MTTFGNSEDPADWVGRRESVEDVIAPGPVVRLSATLDRGDPPPGEGDALPPGWHWLYFLRATPQRGLGPDGHTVRGDFLPPIDLPRRMWAGGRIIFHKPLRIGAAARRDSEIVSVVPKQGRSGALVFVSVRHVISADDGPAIEEEHDIVYREAPRPGDPTPSQQTPPHVPAWQRTVNPDPVFLFRYSALTFNGHRIHYDRNYATEVEGYPGLVVHGPLIATLLLDQLLREHPSDTLVKFDYQAFAPLFDTAPFTIAGAPEDGGHTVALWAARPDGAVAMQGTAVFAP